MTNEEIAVQIQSGRDDLMSQLWEQNTRFFKSRAGQIYHSCREMCDSAGVEYDDIFQSCYFALSDAVAAFDIASGYKLLTYTNYPLKTQINALCGTQSSKRDALNKCKSLDEAIGDDDSDSSLLDLISDPNAEAAFAETENTIFHGETCAALESALSRLPDKHAAAVRGQYLDGKAQGEIAAELGMTQTRVQQIQQDVFRKLRGDVRLQAIRDEILVANSMKKTGFKAFSETWQSSVERALERAEDFTERYIAGGMVANGS